MHASEGQRQILIVDRDLAAVESLRAMRGLPLSGETVTLSAADPLNLIGILVPGERVPAISGRTVSYRDGIAVSADRTSDEGAQVEALPNYVALGAVRNAVLGSLAKAPQAIKVPL